MNAQLILAAATTIAMLGATGCASAATQEREISDGTALMTAAPARLVVTAGTLAVTRPAACETNKSEDPKAEHVIIRISRSTNGSELVVTPNNCAIPEGAQLTWVPDIDLPNPIKVRFVTPSNNAKKCVGATVGKSPEDGSGNGWELNKGPGPNGSFSGPLLPLSIATDTKMDTNVDYTYCLAELDPSGNPTGIITPNPAIIIKPQ